MAKYKLAISIPTYERPDCITDLVNYMIDEAELLNVGIYVFDGSENDDTETACKKYEKYSCFNYIRHNGTVGKRHVEAIYMPDCEYLWLTRDRTILRTEFWSTLINLFEDNRDLYIIADWPTENHLKLYNDPKELINDFGRVMTFFGSFIVKKSFLKNIEETNDSYLYNFPLMYKVFVSAAEKKDFSALYIPCLLKSNYYDINKELGHPCLIGRNFLDIWAKRWVLMFDNLPSFYEADKVKLKMMRSNDFWSFFSILEHCCKKDFTLKEILEYKKYIKQVTNVPFEVMVVLAVLPVFINVLLRELIRPFERIIRRRREKKERDLTR